MKLSQIIAKLSHIIDEHGDLEVFTDEGYAVYDHEFVVDVPSRFPAEYNMPEKFVTQELER